MLKMLKSKVVAAGRRMINQYGVNSFLGSIGQMLAGECDDTRYTDLKKLGYAVDHRGNSRNSRKGWK
jgi:hypothetical protein